MDNKFIEFINNISKRPAMYVGKINIHDVAHFINGYIYGRVDAGNPIFIRQWPRWVELKYMISSPAWNWSRILLHEHGSDMAAIEALPALFQEFFENCPKTREELDKLHSDAFNKKYGTFSYSPEKTHTKNPITS